MLCYCCSDMLFENCCEPFLIGKKAPKTAEELMRSRYTAFCTLNFGYLNQTHLNRSIDFSIDEMISQRWIQLSIISTNKGLENDLLGTVEFKAIYEENGQNFTLHEISEFKKISGFWYYTEGELK